MSLLFVLKVAAAAIGLVVAIVVGLAVWTRRNEGRGDPPDRRTLVVFSGGDAYVTEAERADEEHPRGEGLMLALRAELERRGFAVDEPEASDYAWSAHLRFADVHASLQLGARDDAWLLTVDDPSGGGPGPREVLPQIDAALRALDVTAIEWRRRESNGGESGAGDSSPLT